MFVIYRDTLKSCSDVFRTLKALRKDRKDDDGIYIVRSQCDLFNDEDE